MNLNRFIPAFFFLSLSAIIPFFSYPDSVAAENSAAVLLSVQDFEGLGVEKSLARTVSDLLRTELGRSDRLRLLEETGRLYRMQRESVRFRDLFNEGTLRSLGELLESRFVLTGSVSRLDSVIVISSRIVDAETGEVLAAESAENRGGLSALGAAARTLARKVLAYFPLTGRITAVKGDTLAADLGLADGILPGQELTVADLEEKAAGLTTRPLRSSRYRVADALDHSCSLIPLIGLNKVVFAVGASVFSPGGLDRLLAAGARRKSEGLPESDTGKFGEVEVESVPAGALALVAGLDVGRTPVKVSRLAAGLQELILSLPGYKEVFDSITVTPGQLGKFHYDLERQTGRLTIFTVQPGITLRIDTLEVEVADSGSVDLPDFPAGIHEIEARKPGYKTWQSRIDLNFRQDSTLTVTLEPYPGSLFITSRPPGANIFIDGNFTGKATPWRLTRLESGARIVRLSLAGYGAALDTAEVQPGKDATLDLELKKGWFDFQPFGMTLVPAARLVTEQNDSVMVDTFYIDIYEVTNRAYAFFVAAANAKAPEGWVNNAPPAGEEDLPVAGVSFEEAERFAAWCGKRLPTEQEWALAAIGPAPHRFPWGESYHPGAANIWSEGLNHGAKVGSYPEDKSIFGLFDVVGNVAEWVDAWTDENQTYRVYRGGSYYVNETDPSLFSRDGHYPNSKNRYIGFRCARSLHSQR